MSEWSRYAIYYLPPAGPLADFGAMWLGWDVSSGASVSQPDLPGISALTEAPRKYGFHGTLKPPFRLAEGQDAGALDRAVAGLAARTAPARCDGLALSRLGRFMALTPVGDTVGIGRVAAACVTELDGFRRPLTPADLARRRAGGLSARQETLLAEWGYPHVLDEFRFHLTLTGPLADGTCDSAERALHQLLPPLPQPFILNEIALAGEGADGRFSCIHRYPLTG